MSSFKVTANICIWPAFFCGKKKKVPWPSFEDLAPLDAVLFSCDREENEKNTVPMSITITMTIQVNSGIHFYRIYCSKEAYTFRYIMIDLHLSENKNTRETGRRERQKG